MTGSEPDVEVKGGLFIGPTETLFMLFVTSRGEGVRKMGLTQSGLKSVFFFPFPFLSSVPFLPPPPLHWPSPHTHLPPPLTSLQSETGVGSQTVVFSGVRVMLLF